MEQYALTGLGWFIGTATFVGAWVLLLSLFGFACNLLKEAEEDEDDEE